MGQFSRAVVPSVIDDVMSTFLSFDLAPFLYPLHDHWALSPETMQFVARLVEVNQPSKIIEFGSGHSTKVLTAVAEKYGGRLLSLDHKKDFALQTEERVRDSGFAGVATVLHCGVTLRRYGLKLLPSYSIRWKQHKEFENCELALVDGPHGSIGREAVMYELFPRLMVGGMILVDDMNRESEQRWLKSWMFVFGDALEAHILPTVGRGIGLLRKVKNISPSYRFQWEEVWESWCHSAKVVHSLLRRRL